MQYLLKLSKNLWVLILIATVFVGYRLHRHGHFEYCLGGDSAIYLQMADQPVGVAWLQEVRTFGYPAFLAIVQEISSVEQVPYFHYLFYVACVVVLALALRSWGMHPLCNALICCCVIRSKIRIYNHIVISDVIGCAMAVAAIGCTLALMKPKAHKLWWFGLVATVFLSYQVRPIYLCMMPFSILGIMVGRFVYERYYTEVIQTNYKRLIVGVSAIAILPFLGFCALRYAAVEHFGIVSFGGYSAAGIGGCLLVEDDIPHLSDDLQPLAREILKRRNDPQIRIDAGQSAEQWQPIVDHSKILRINYLNVIDQYDFVLYHATLGAPKDILLGAEEGTYDEANTQVIINQRLSDLSQAVFGRHRVDYAYLIGNSFLYSFEQAYVSHRVFRRLLWCAVIALAIRLLVVSLGKRSYGVPSQFNSQQYVMAGLVAYASVLFFLGNIGVIALVEVPFQRYINAATTMLPAVAIPFLFADVQTIWATLTLIREQRQGEGGADQRESVELEANELGLNERRPNELGTALAKEQKAAA